MIDKIKARLLQLGHEAKDEDELSLFFLISKVENHIKNFCNVKEVPEKAEEIAIDMVCGEFLFALNQRGKLDEAYNVEKAIKSVKIGDTDITYADGASQADKIDILIANLLGRAGDLVCFRKLRW